MVGMAAVGAATPAAAQQAPQSNSDAAESSAGPQEVTITGTRLRATGMNTPTPVTVVSAAQLDEVSPGNIAQAIKQLPQFRGNVDATQNNGIGTDAGQSTVNMRGLGANRTLVLLDGRRLVPSTYNGTVDINVLPQSLLQRTDVVTGGASAAYGSDAVAGVVNFILDTTFTGLKGSVQAGITGRGDGANKQGELTFGTAIGERAHLIAAVDYYDNNAIQTVRPWMQSWGAVNDPTAADNNHYIVKPNVGSSIYTPGGLIVAPGTPLNNLQFLADGSAVPFRLGYGTQRGVQGMSGGDAYDFRRDGMLFRTSRSMSRTPCKSGARR
jgi:outer membrane receptor protein involved in Fe transport